MKRQERSEATIETLRAYHEQGQEWVREVDISARVGLKDDGFMRLMRAARKLKTWLGVEPVELQESVGELYIFKEHAVLADLVNEGIVKEDWEPSPASPHFPRGLIFRLAD